MNDRLTPQREAEIRKRTGSHCFGLMCRGDEDRADLLTLVDELRAEVRRLEGELAAVRVAVTDPDEPVGEGETLAEAAEGWKFAAIDAQRDLAALRSTAREREETAVAWGYDEGYLACATKKLRNSAEGVARWRKEQRTSQPPFKAGGDWPGPGRTVRTDGMDVEVTGGPGDPDPRQADCL